MRYVHDTATAADRDPKSVEVCVAAPAAYVGNDLTHQRNQGRWFDGMLGNDVADLVARYGEGGEIPAALTNYVKARQDYDYGHHGTANNPTTDCVPDEIVETASVFSESLRTTSPSLVCSRS